MQHEAASPNGYLDDYIYTQNVLQSLARRYHEDSAFRKRIDGGDVAPVVEELREPIPFGMQARVVANSRKLFHLVLPFDPDSELPDDMLEAVAGGVPNNADGPAAFSHSSALGSILNMISPSARSASTF